MAELEGNQEMLVQNAGPLSDILDINDIPSQYLNQDIAELVSKVKYISFEEVAVDPTKPLKYEMQIYLDQMIELHRKCLELIVLEWVPQEDGSGKIYNLEITKEGDKFKIVLFDFDLRLSVPNSILQPIEIDPQTRAPLFNHEGDFLKKPGKLILVKAQGKLTIDQKLDFDLSGSKEAAYYPFQIASLPIAIVPTEVIMDLSSKKKPPKLADMDIGDEFQGAVLRQLDIHFIQCLSFLPQLKVRDLIVGKSGVSVKVKADFNETHVTEFYGFKLLPHDILLDIQENELLLFNVGTTLFFPYFGLEGDADRGISAEFSANSEEGIFQVKSTELNFWGFKFLLEAFDFKFHWDSLDDANFNGYLSIPYLKKEDGTDAVIGMNFVSNFQTQNHLIAVRSDYNFKFYGLKIDLKAAEIPFTSNSFDNVTLEGSICYPCLPDGDKHHTDIKLTVGKGKYAIQSNYRDIIEFWGLRLDLKPIGLEFSHDEVLQFAFGGTLFFPFDNHVRGVDASILYEEEQLRMRLINTEAIECFGMRLLLGKTEIALSEDGLDELCLDAMLEIEALKQEDGETASIPVRLSYEEASWRIEADPSNLPAFDIQGMKLKFDYFSFAIDEAINIESAVTGSLSWSDDQQVNVKLHITDKGFELIATLEEGEKKVLDQDGIVSIFLNQLKIGYQNEELSLGVGGRLVNGAEIPLAEKLLPQEILIPNFTVSNKDIDLDFELKWSETDRLQLLKDQLGKIFPFNFNLGPLISVQGISINKIKEDMTGEFMPIVPAPSTKGNGATRSTKASAAVPAPQEVAGKQIVDVRFLGAKIEMGPVTAIIEGLGFSGTITRPESGKGNFGPVQVDYKLNKPTGVGVSLQTGIIRGGGYLHYDENNGLYMGAIELSFRSSVSLNAFGVLSPTLPNGKRKTSLLVVITTEFGTPLALGYNFYLKGVGGIVGLHRTLNSEALQKSVRTGSVDKILFPKQLIKNIHSVVSNLSAVFPIKEDQFLVGPMAVITWNVPTVMRAELGLIVEFDDPVRLAILGVVKVGVPTVDKPLIKLNVSFIGVIDFDKGSLQFDASLFDSKIMKYTLEGDMALRINWGDQQNFALSVGGFHPQYKVPRSLGISKMKRLTIGLMGGNPRLTLTTYFAVTTNSVQFGALVDFYMKAWKVKVLGFFGFDVLFMFDPFHFVAQVVAGLAVKWGSKTLFSIGLKFKLIGPSPWVASGYAKFTIVFWSVKARFKTTFGASEESLLPSTRVLDVLIAETTRNSNWKAILPEFHQETVRFKQGTETDDYVLINPMGSLQISQSQVPLNIALEKFGETSIEGSNYFHYAGLDIIEGENLEPLPSENIRSSFSPALYKKMDDIDKLIRVEFQPMDGGLIATGSDQLESAGVVFKELKYEEVVPDSNIPLNQSVKPKTGSAISQEEFDHLVRGSDVAQSHLSKMKKRKIRHKKKAISIRKDVEYQIVYKGSLEPYHAAGFSRGTEIEAQEVLNRITSTSPSLGGKLMLASNLQLANNY